MNDSVLSFDSLVLAENARQERYKTAVDALDKYSYTYFAIPEINESAKKRISMVSAGQINEANLGGIMERLPGKQSIDTCIMNAAHYASQNTDNSPTYLSIEKEGSDETNYACYISPHLWNSNISERIGKSNNPESGFGTIDIYSIPTAFVNEKDVFVALDDVGGLYVSYINDNDIPKRFFSLTKDSSLSPQFAGKNTPTTNFAYLQSTSNNNPFSYQLVVVGGTKENLQCFTMKLGLDNDLQTVYEKYNDVAQSHPTWLNDSKRQFLVGSDNSTAIDPIATKYCTAITSEEFIVSSDARVRLIIKNGYLTLQICVPSIKTMKTILGDITVKDSSVETNTFAIMDLSVDSFWDKIHLVDANTNKSALVLGGEISGNGMKSYANIFPFDIWDSVAMDTKSCAKKCAEDPDCKGVYSFTQNGTEMCKRLPQTSTSDYIFNNITTPLFSTGVDGISENESITNSSLHLKGRKLDFASEDSSSLIPVQQLNQIQPYDPVIPVFSNEIFDPKNPYKLPKMSPSLALDVVEMDDAASELLNGPKHKRPEMKESFETGPLGDSLRSSKKMLRKAIRRNEINKDREHIIRNINLSKINAYIDNDSNKNIDSIYATVYGGGDPSMKRGENTELEVMGAEFTEQLFRTNQITTLIAIILAVLAILFYRISRTL